MVGRGGLSWSFAINVSTVFVFTNFVCSKQKTSALRSLPLKPNKTTVLWWFSPHLYTQNKRPSNKCYLVFYGGQGWVRTTVVSRRQIYSLLPLATRAPTLSLTKSGYLIVRFYFNLRIFSCQFCFCRVGAPTGGPSLNLSLKKDT